MTNRRTTFRRYAIPVAVVMVMAAVRFALPARSAVITPSATDKLTVYSGVIMIIPNSTSALELGNAGRDIVSSKELYLRPSSSLQGSKFTLEPAACAIDGKQCGDIGDCDDVIDPKTGSKQACLNNLQDLTLTGDLTVQGSICFATGGGQECVGSWPDNTSIYWTLTNDRLSPMVPSGLGIAPTIRIGDSRGYCNGANHIRCYSNDDCGSTPTRICSVSPVSGITGMNALSIYSTTSGAALSVTRGTTIGDVTKDYYRKTGNTVMNGSVYVDGRAVVRDYSLMRSYDIWSAAAPTDTQDGSGIDADTLNGTASLPFTVAGEQNDLRWWQFYQNPTGKTFPGATLAEDGGGIMPLMCLHIKSSTKKVCVDGADAGKVCNNNEDCINNATCQELCNPAQGQCSVDNIMYCQGTSPRVVCSTDADCGGTSCIEDTGMLKCAKKAVDENFYRSCLVDADCPVVYGGNSCGPGKLYAANPACTIEGKTCQSYCQDQKKCTGATTGSCSTFGGNINYNTGTCVEKDGNRFCRCSLNMRDVTSLPYIDMTTYVSAFSEGEACSLPFQVSNQPHPAPNP